MTLTSKLNEQDIRFLQQLMADITNELCECDCCKKEKGCSIFERVYIAANVLYHKIVDTDDNDNPSFLFNVLVDEDDCWGWETITARVNGDSARKGRFVDKARGKILSRFYMFFYNMIGENGIPRNTGDQSYLALTRDIFTNAEDVIANCIDTCCNDSNVH